MSQNNNIPQTCQSFSLNTIHHLPVQHSLSFYLNPAPKSSFCHLFLIPPYLLHLPDFPVRFTTSSFFLVAKETNFD